LVAVGFGAAVVSSVQVAAEAISRLVDGAVTGVNVAIQGFNKLPGVEIEGLDVDWTDSAFMRSFRRMGDELRDKVGVVRGELHDLAMQPLPSAQVEKFFEDVQKRAQEA